MKYLGLVALILAVQGPPVPVLPATVHGRVVDAVTGQPLVRATVQLLGVSAPRGTSYVLSRDTAADGSFSFSNVPPGDYMIEASRGGYVTNTYGKRDNVTPPQILQPGKVLSGVEIALTPGGVIYGRLADDRGDPVIGATVQAWRRIYREGRRDFVVAQTVTSNDLGDYRLYLLMPGEYHVSVTEPSLFGSGSIPWFYPGAVDRSEAQAISVKAGEIVGGVSFRAVPTRVQRVSGVVHGAGGDGVAVILASRGGNVRMEATADPQTGAFQFGGVPPGAYTLVAHTTKMQSSMPLDIRGGDITNARITLPPGLTIPVRVRIEGHAVPDPELENLYFTVRRDPATTGLADDMYSPFADGRLMFELPAGDYRVDITRPQDAYVTSMKIGDVDVLNQGLRVTASSEIPLEIVVGLKPGSVSGRVSGKSGATAVLVPDADRRNHRALYKSARVSSSGEFQFPRVPPGEYKLFVWQEENGGPWLDPEYLRQYEDRATPVQVKAGARTIVEGLVPVF